MASKSIAIVCTAGSIGGMERVVCSLSRRFTASGERVRTLFPASAKSERLIEWCAGLGAQAQATAAVLDAEAPHTWLGVVKLAAALRGAEIVNFHYGSNFVSVKDILGAKLAGARQIYATLHMAEGWDSLGERKRQMTAVAAKHLTRFIAISAETEKLLLDAGIEKGKIERIYCGVRAPAQSTKADGRKRLNLPADAFVVAMAARLVAYKGALELVQACAAVSEACPNLHLVIAGDGPERLPLEKVAHRLLGKRVQMLGLVTERIEDIYAAADVFALPSDMEGLPLVYVEAAMQGTPSIASDVGGTREVVIDGETGLVVPARDVDAFAAAIRRVYADEPARSAMGEKARARAIELFGEDRMYADYRRLFGMGADTAA